METIVRSAAPCLDSPENMRPPVPGQGVEDCINTQREPVPPITTYCTPLAPDKQEQKPTVGGPI